MFKLAFFMCVCVLVQAQIDVVNVENDIEYYGSDGGGIIENIGKGIDNLGKGIANIGKSIGDVFSGKGVDEKGNGGGILDNVGNGPIFGNGGLLDRVSNRAASILVPILKGVDKAITSFESQLESFKNSVFNNIDKLRGVADSVQDQLKEFVEKMAENLKGIVANFADGQTDVTPCGDIVIKFKDQMLEMALNSSNCAKKLVDGAVGGARNVTNAGDRILENLNLARKNLIKCGDNMEGGMKNFASGLRCITDSNLKSARIIASEIPSFLVESAKTATSVVTAAPKVQSCVTSSVLGAVSSHYKIVLKQVGECLTNLGKSFNPIDFPAPEAPKIDAVKDNQKKPAKANEKKVKPPKDTPKKPAPISNEQKKLYLQALFPGADLDNGLF